MSVGAYGWPKFLAHDPIAIATRRKHLRYFAQDQLSLLNGNAVAAVANSLPVRVNADLSLLSDRGLNWGLQASITDHENGVAPNALMGVQIVVAAAFQGQQMGVAAARALVDHAQATGLDYVVLPLRPSDKKDYPLIPLLEYITWENEKGLPFDRWLRIHHVLGGTMIKVCQQSMTISGTLEDWQSWTGQVFPGSGDYIVPGALNPVCVDHGAGLATYVEPNIWVVHRVPAAV